MRALGFPTGERGGAWLAPDMPTKLSRHHGSAGPLPYSMSRQIAEHMPMPRCDTHTSRRRSRARASGPVQDRARACTRVAQDAASALSHTFSHGHVDVHVDIGSSTRA